MFVVKDLDDRTTEKYETVEQIYQHCEGIDVNNGLYEFSDEDGNLYDIEWIEKVKSNKWLFITWVTQGKYRLVKRNK